MHIKTADIILSKLRITKALIRLICAFVARIWQNSSISNIIHTAQFDVVSIYSFQSYHVIGVAIVL